PAELRRALAAALRAPARRSDRQWRLWADALFQSGRGREAAGPARAALNRSPLDAELHLVVWRAQDPRGLGGPKEAALLERATQLGLDVPEAWAWLGRCRLDAGAWGAGVEALARAVALDPARAWEHAAWPATFSGAAPRGPNEARRAALAALRVPRAQAPLAAYLRSRVAAILNRPAEAERCLKAARPLFAAAPWFFDGALGEVRVRHGRFAAALGPLARAAEGSPEPARALFWRGEALYWLGRGAQAEASWAAAVAREPKKFWARAWRAQTLLWQGRWAEAEREAAAAVALESGHGWAWGWLGAAKARGGRPAEGLKDLRRALALDPTDREARIVVGEALALAGRPREALAALAEAARRDPAHPWVWLLRAWVRGESGDEGGMLDDYARAGLYAPALLPSWTRRRPRPDSESVRGDLAAALARWKGNRTWRAPS
ncbi:tetratricopeptide repeat protein, partial [bacterium]